MPFIPISNIAQVKKLTDEPKFGTVVFNKDPEMLGRIKVQIPGIFDGEPEELPWVRRKTDTVFCGNDCEIFDVPEIGSIVEVKWNYDESTPMYSGAPYSKRKATTAFFNNYPHEAGIKFGDCLIKFDKASKLVTIENGAAQIVLDSMGTCSIACDELEIKADENIFMSAKQITLDGSVSFSGSGGDGMGADGVLLPGTVATVKNGRITSITS